MNPITVTLEKTLEAIRLRVTKALESQRHDEALAILQAAQDIAQKGGKNRRAA
jgi:hypothetical protein